MASRAEGILAGKGALITGGSRGIGKAIAETYARAGARVLLCGRDKSSVRSAVHELAGAGAVDGVSGDVGDAADVEKIVQAALDHCGRIDVLVNNASILGARASIESYPPAVWDEVLRINLTGIFRTMQAVLPGMRSRESGSIINVSSGVARRGRGHWGAYAVSKAGLECLTQVLADELKTTRIRVNSVNPAATRTAMRAQAYPLEDPKTLPPPQEIMPIFLYLASDASLSVSGQSLEARGWVWPGD